MAAAPVVLFLTAVWAAGFVAIYTRPHSRVEASRWIYANVPRGSVLANEHWDDGLPLRVDGKDGFGGWYKGIEITNYDEDTPEKLDKLVRATGLGRLRHPLQQPALRLDPAPADALPDDDALLRAAVRGRARATSRSPSSPRIRDCSASSTSPTRAPKRRSRSTTIPRSTSSGRRADFDAAEVRSKLSEGIDWENIQRLTPLQATRAKGTLMLSPTDQAVYQDGGTWSAIFSLDAWQNQLPVLAWVLIVELLGLVAAPLCLVVLRRLADGGYAVAKTLGLLLTAWLAWLLASARIAPFGLPAVAIGLGVLALISAGAAGPALAIGRCRFVPRALAAAARRGGRLLAAVPRRARHPLQQPGPLASGAGRREADGLRLPERGRQVAPTSRRTTRGSPAATSTTTTSASSWWRR